MTGRGETSRCLSCGGLVAPDAEWCGQCYEPVGERGAAGGDPVQSSKVAKASPNGASVGSSSGDSTQRALKLAPHPAQASEAEVSEPEAGHPEEPTKRPTWPCPVCDATNPMDLDVCRSCGTPFARLFEEPKEMRHVEPRAAATLSLVLPGLGHARCGKAAEGFARAVMFGWALAMSILLAASSHGGAGILLPMVGLFALIAVAVYLLTAVDAYRVAEGAAQLLTPRILLIGMAGLVMLSLASFFLIVARATSQVG